MFHAEAQRRRGVEAQRETEEKRDFEVRCDGGDGVFGELLEQGAPRCRA